MPSGPSSPLATMRAISRTAGSNAWVWPTIEMDVGALDRLDNGVAIGERQRHRLFQNDVLAGRGESWRAAHGIDAASRCRPSRPRIVAQLLKVRVGTAC